MSPRLADMARPRTGLFGGTFDPPHVGHVAALRAAAASGRFDRIEVVVAGTPYTKVDARDVRSADERLEMAQSAFAGLDLVHVSDLEVRRDGPSYSIDTVLELMKGSLSVDILVGADVAASMGTWHRSEELADLVKVGVFPRPGTPMSFPAGFVCYEIAMTPVDLSSTAVRSLDTVDAAEVVPEAVLPFLDPTAE